MSHPDNEGYLSDRRVLGPPACGCWKIVDGQQYHCWQPAVAQLVRLDGIGRSRYDVCANHFDKHMATEPVAIGHIYDSNKVKGMTHVP